MAFTAFEDLAYVGVGKETTQGTGVAPSKFLKFEQAAYLIDQSFLSWNDPNQRDRTVEAKSKVKYAGGVKTLCYVDELAAMLAWAFGASSDTVTGAGDPWTHTLALKDTQPYLSVEVGYYTNAPSTPTFQLVDRVIDSKINMIEISGEAGKEIVANIDFLGLNPTKQAATATITYTDSAGQGPLLFSQSVFTLTGATDAATMQGQISKFSVKMSNGLQIAEANSLIGIGIIEGMRTIDVSFTVIFTGPSQYQLTYYGGASGTAPLLAIGQGSLQIVTTAQASPERSLTLKMPGDLSANLNFNIGKLKPSPDGKIAEMDVSAHALKPSGQQAIVAIIKNAVSAAYN